MSSSSSLSWPESSPLTTSSCSSGSGGGGGRGSSSTRFFNLSSDNRLFCRLNILFECISCNQIGEENLGLEESSSSMSTSSPKTNVSSPVPASTEVDLEAAGNKATFCAAWLSSPPLANGIFSSWISYFKSKDINLKV